MVHLAQLFCIIVLSASPYTQSAIVGDESLSVTATTATTTSTAAIDSPSQSLLRRREGLTFKSNNRSGDATPAVSLSSKLSRKLLFSPKDPTKKKKWEELGWTLPDWWPAYRVGMTKFHLKRCPEWHGTPPQSGDSCKRVRRKKYRHWYSCMFGEQECPSAGYGYHHPTTKCDCVRGVWDCNAWDPCMRTDSCPLGPSPPPTDVEKSPICIEDLPYCSYGEQDCCGKKESRIVCHCDSGKGFECKQKVCPTVCDLPDIDPLVPLPIAEGEPEVEGQAVAPAPQLTFVSCPRDDPTALVPSPSCERAMVCEVGDVSCCGMTHAEQMCTCEKGGPFECVPTNACEGDCSAKEGDDLEKEPRTIDITPKTIPRDENGNPIFPGSLNVDVEESDGKNPDVDDLFSWDRSICPEDPPELGESCNGWQYDTLCEYGEMCCCGECTSETRCLCLDGPEPSVVCLSIEFRCQDPCPNDKKPDMDGTTCTDTESIVEIGEDCSCCNLCVPEWKCFCGDDGLFNCTRTVDPDQLCACDAEESEKIPLVPTIPQSGDDDVDDVDEEETELVEEIVKRKRKRTVCPRKRPREGKRCALEEGHTCEYGENCCCEECHTCSCDANGRFSCAPFEMECFQPCPPQPLATGAVVEFAQEDHPDCPEEAPQNAEFCDIPLEYSCHYDEEECCGQKAKATRCTCDSGMFSCYTLDLKCPEVCPQSVDFVLP